MQRRKLIDWTEDYLWELRQRRGERGKATWVNEASTVRRLAEWYDKTHRSPSSLDVVTVRGYLFGVRETNWPGIASAVGPRTFNNYLQRIKAYCRWLEEQGVIKSSMRICAIENKRPVETEKHRIDRPQMRRMLSNATDPWERWLLVAAIQTAGRVSELECLRVKHLRAEARKVMWYRPKTGTYDELTAMPMLLREANVWMTYLADQGVVLDGESFLVPHRRRFGHSAWKYYPQMPISRQTVGYVVKKHLLQFFTEEELRGEASHVLRRSAARELYEVWKEMGVPDPMRKVQALLGHSSITQTEVYIGIRRDREERNELMDGLDWLAVSDENVVDLGARRGHGQRM